MTAARVALVTATTILVLAVLSLRGWGMFQVGVYHDDASYLVLSRSILAGDGFGMIDAPGPPRPGKYPFVFPLLLAPVSWAFPYDLDRATLVSLAATAINVVLLVYGWPRLCPSSSRRWALAVAALYAVSPMVVAHSRMVMSEPVFLAFALASLMLIERCARERSGAAAAVALGAALALASFTRPVGLALWAAAAWRLLPIAWRASRSSAPLALGAGIAAGVALVLVVAVGVARVEIADLAPLEHVGELSEGRRALPRGASAVEGPPRPSVAWTYASDTVASVLLPVGFGARSKEWAARAHLPFLPAAIGLSFSALVVVGGWSAWRAGALAASVAAFEVFYAAVLVAWPWAQGRLLYPLLPFLLFQALVGIRLLVGTLARASSAGAARRLAGGAVAAACALLFTASVAKDLRLEDSRRFTLDLEAGTVWLRHHAAPESVVAAHYGPAVYLYSGLKTVGLPTGEGEDEVASELARDGVDYVLVGPRLVWGAERQFSPRTRTLLPILGALAAGGRLELVYESAPADGVRVFRRPP